jgi:hypothetical protein
VKAKMKEEIKISLLRVYLKDKYLLVLLVLNFSLCVLMWLLFLFKFKRAEVPIFSPFFIVSENSFLQTYLLPMTASLIFAINLILSFFSRRREALSSYLLLGTSILVFALVLAIFQSYAQLFL